MLDLESLVKLNESRAVELLIVDLKKSYVSVGKIHMLEDRVKKLEYELKELKSIVSNIIWKEE